MGIIEPLLLEVTAKPAISLFCFSVVTVDKNQAPSFFGDGGFLLVKSATLQTQGRKIQALGFFGDGDFWMAKSSTVGIYLYQALGFSGDGGFWLESAASATPAEESTLRGCPHIISFDQAGTDKNQALSVFGDGVFWLFKSSSVQIPGRLSGTL